MQRNRKFQHGAENQTTEIACESNQKLDLTKTSKKPLKIFRSSIGNYV